MTTRLIVGVSSIILTLMCLVHTASSARAVNSSTGCNMTETEDGFALFFQTNKEEMEDVPVTFDRDLPVWLKGTLVRNGLGRFEKGPRTFLHAFDGFAKLASWKFSGNSTVLFSTKFLRSNFYKESMKTKTIAPYLLFQSVSPPFGFYEKLKCLVRGIDNMNVNIYGFTNPKNRRVEYGALSDFWISYKVDIANLTTKHRIVPRIKNTPKTATETQGTGFLNLLSSAHPLPYPNSNDHLTFLSSVAFFPWDDNVINLIRIKSLKRRKIIAQWPVERVPYMHSFSVTQTKAILLASPLYVNVMCMARKVEPFSCLDWKPNEPSTLYVISLKSRRVQKVMTPCLFSMHHVNAYDADNDTIIMDISSYPNPDFVNHLQLHVLRDPVKRNSFDAHAKLKRIRIDLANSTASEIPFDFSPLAPSIASYLDMPVINEAYRSKHYCFIYGLVLKTDNITLNKVAIVKKDMCFGGEGDKVWEVTGSYPVEPWFVARPQALEEDDGILLVPMLHGVRRLTYLAVLDAKTLTLISSADMPTFIPYSLHGRFIFAND